MSSSASPSFPSFPSFPSDVVPMDISIPTARMIASFLKGESEGEEDDHQHKAHLLETLETSRVSQEVLANSDLEETLAVLAWNEECGSVVRRILSRFFQISQGKMDPINVELEKTWGLAAHETPDERRKRLFSEEEPMEINNEGKEVVMELPREEPMERVEVEEKEANDLKVEKPVEKELGMEMSNDGKEDKKRKVDEEEKEQEVSAKVVKLDCLTQNNSATINLDIKCRSESEKKEVDEKSNKENKVSAALIASNIDLYERQKEKEAIQKKERETEEKEIKKVEENPLRVLVSKNFDLYRKELERQKNSENKTNDISSLISPLPFIDFKAKMANKEMINGFKEVKEIGISVQKVQNGKTVEVEMNKVPKTVKAKKSVSKVSKTDLEMNKVTKKVSKTEVSKMGAKEVYKKKANKADEVKPVEQPSPAQILAKNLENLSQQPSRVDVLTLIEGLTPELLREAEKIIGREMGRVDLLWYEMTIRDFGKPKTKWLCDARDLYRGMAALAERKKQRMEEEAKQGILV